MTVPARSPACPGKPRGFTLVELMVVLVIVGLLLTLAPVAFQSAVPSLQVKSAAQELAAVMRATRSRAIKENREHVVQVDVESGRYRGGRADQEEVLDPDIALSLLTAESELDENGGGRIRFYPDGTSTGGRVSLTLGDTTYHVLVDWLTGRIQVADRIAEEES
ncbi:MAG: GspH/FimT family protein [Kiloniellales bacterium]|nr:GspH/FimT family protein [Kiloniellales bacterium]